MIVQKYPNYQNTQLEMTACTANDECMSNNCNVGNGNCEPVCIGECCIETESCSPGDCCYGLTCDPLTSTCIPKEEETNIEELDCVQDSNCGTGEYCDTGVCEQEKPNGETCTQDYECLSDRCDTTCMDKLPDGQPCDENSDCILNQCEVDTCLYINTPPTLISVIPDATEVIAGATVTFTFSWTDPGDTVKLMLSDDPAFTDCNYAVTTGCLAVTGDETSSPTDLVHQITSELIWYAQACDATNCLTKLTNGEQITNEYRINDYTTNSQSASGVTQTSFGFS